jgi:4-amino-4-deoxy-L-arabinose transferase-like glycosyltransferase
LLALVLLHLAIGASIGLSVDEAHYLLYAAYPDWSYFDHPPLVGWVQWPLVALGAPSGCCAPCPARCGC